MSRPLPARFRSSVVGRLEVIALCDSRRGLSDSLVPAGMVGYVVGVYGIFAAGPRPVPAGGRPWLVFWPALRESSSHPRADLRPTGRRGAWPVTG